MVRKKSDLGRRAVLTALGLAVLPVQVGCLHGPEFRDAALPAIESGLDLILDGVVDGVFAAIQVESTTDS